MCKNRPSLNFFVALLRHSMFSVADDGQMKDVLCFRAAIDIAKGSELYVDYLGSEHLVGNASPHL